MKRFNTKKFLEETYRKRYKEIESLRKYDSGEKEIFPLDLAAFSRECERIRNREYPYQQESSHPMQTPYERMQQSAFNLMRKNSIKDFSAEELHRVFKHAKEQLLYTAIIRNAIEDGLTIASLYEQDHDNDIER